MESVAGSWDWNALARADRRPRAFDPGDGLFWADPYIAEHVVWAHLDDRSSDASRPLKQIEAEVEWIDALSPRRGRLLDLGCGVGRHSLLFAQRGWSVTGVDVAAPSLEFARQEAADAGLGALFLQGDLRTLPLPSGQDLILLAYGTIGTLSPSQAKRLVGRCRRALSPGGRLVFDAFRRPWWEKQLKAAGTRTWSVVPEEGFWTGAAHLVLSRTDAYPSLRTFGRTYTVVEADRVRRFPLWYRWFDPEHLADELLTGWKVSFTGGLDGRRLSPGSPWVAAVAQRKE
jgi:SAM-dependent methyltransferase